MFYEILILRSGESRPVNVLKVISGRWPKMFWIGLAPTIATLHIITTWANEVPQLMSELEVNCKVMPKCPVSALWTEIGAQAQGCNALLAIITWWNDQSRLSTWGTPLLKMRNYETQFFVIMSHPGFHLEACSTCDTPTSTRRGMKWRWVLLSLWNKCVLDSLTNIMFEVWPMKVVC
jgi:hypothetical protein